MARVIVREQERAVVRRDGTVVAVLGPGRHILPRRGWGHAREVCRVDVRERVLLVAGQELSAADVPGVRVSVVVIWRVADPAAFLTVAGDPVEVLRVGAQLAVRDAVAARELSRLTCDRGDLADELGRALKPWAARVGIELVRVEPRDVSLPGELRRALLSVQTARQDGLATLERARGETAAWRALANGARVLADHPALLQLRTAQAAAEAGGTVIVRADSQPARPVIRLARDD